MTQRRWWILGGIGVVASIAVAAGVFALSTRRPSECAVVRSMLDYNKQFAEGVNSENNAGSEPTDAEYTQWVAHLRGFADQIHGDQSLAEPADEMADLAVQIAKLAPRPQTDSSAMPQQATAPRPSLRESLYISKEFNENLTVLEGACSG